VCVCVHCAGFVEYDSAGLMSRGGRPVTTQLSERHHPAWLSPRPPTLPPSPSHVCRYVCTYASQPGHLRKLSSESFRRIVRYLVIAVVGRDVNNKKTKQKTIFLQPQRARCVFIYFYYFISYYIIQKYKGGSVAEWLACWTHEQKGPVSNHSRESCRVTVLGKLFTPIVPLFTKQQNW